MENDSSNYTIHLLEEISFMKQQAASVLTEHLQEDVVVKEFQLIQKEALNGDFEVSREDFIGKGYPIQCFHALVSVHELTVLESAIAMGKRLDAAALAYKFGGAIVNLVAATNTTMLDYAKRFQRKGKVQKKTRSESSFTQSLKYLIGECRKAKKTELLDPKNTDNFMKFAQLLIKDTKGQDQYLASKIQTVKAGSGGYFMMQENHGKVGMNTKGNPLKYSRRDIQEGLKKLITKEESIAK